MFVNGAALAVAQPSAILDDLEQRAIAAMSGIRRTQSWSVVLRARDLTRTRIVQSLNLSRPFPVAGRAFLYEPKPAATTAPGVVLVRPHVDPAATNARRLPAAITRMGMFVLELDAHAHHSRFDLLAEGVVPEGLIQRDVRAALSYLKARPDIDIKRLAILGDGLAATVAAAINADFSAVVLVDGAPDFVSVLSELRSAVSDQFSDSCILLPGMLRYAATEERLALIAPRPLLLIGAAEGPLEYATSVYRSTGKGEISSVAEGGWTAATRFATYAWLARSLEGRSFANDLREPDVFPDPIQLQLAAGSPAQSRTTGVPVSEQSLFSTLGAPLPEGSLTYGINCRGDQRIDFYPQSGIKIPVTVLRPGPDACGEARGTLIAVDDRGRASLANDQIVQEAIRRDWVVWTLDPRCVGEAATKAEPFVFGVSLLLGENLAWRQAADLLRLLRRVGGTSSRYPTALYARGRNMSIVASYVAAIASRRELDWIVLRDAAATFRGLTDVAPSVIPFDVVQLFDVADVWNAAKGKLLVIEHAEEFLGREWPW